MHRATAGSSSRKARRRCSRWRLALRGLRQLVRPSGSIRRRSASPRFVRHRFARTRELPLTIFCLFARTHSALASDFHTPGYCTSTAHTVSTRVGWLFLANSPRARFLTLSTMQRPASRSRVYPSLRRFGLIQRHLWDRLTCIYSWKLALCFDLHPCMLTILCLLKLAPLVLCTIWTLLETRRHRLEHSVIRAFFLCLPTSCSYLVSRRSRGPSYAYLDRLSLTPA